MTLSAYNNKASTMITSHRRNRMFEPLNEFHHDFAKLYFQSFFSLQLLM